MSNVIVANTKSDEVYKLLDDKLVPMLAGEPLAIAAAAMLMLIATSMKPNIDGDDLVDVITETSAFIVTKLSSLDDDQGSVN